MNIAVRNVEHLINGELLANAMNLLFAPNAKKQPSESFPHLCYFLDL
jgi:hypothetical protein